MVKLSRFKRSKLSGHRKWGLLFLMAVFALVTTVGVRSQLHDPALFPNHEQVLQQIGTNRISPEWVDQNFDLVAIEQPRILAKADQYLGDPPRTVTADRAPLSPGGPHDFYSQGDYWWPNPKNPDGAYLKKDGESNPDNFVAHRQSMIRLSDRVSTFASAYVLTGESQYVDAALTHLRAWFVAPETRMNPSLLYGQAIQGKVTGRSIGIIDTIHLTEVARSVMLLGESSAFPQEDLAQIKAWFRTYLTWLNTHPYGKKERVHPNNHGVCWSLQAGAFAQLVGDEAQLSWIRDRFKTDYLKRMMNQQGGFPAELKRTKPYGYALFVLDAVAGVAQIASTEEEDLWQYELPDGRSLKKGLEFLFPYIQEKSAWPLAPDVLYWEDWPVRHPSLLFGGLHYNNVDYLETWQELEADPQVNEVVRNFPLRHPLLWLPTRQGTGSRD